MFSYLLGKTGLKKSLTKVISLAYFLAKVNYYLYCLVLVVITSI